MMSLRAVLSVEFLQAFPPTRGKPPVSVVKTLDFLICVSQHPSGCPRFGSKWEPYLRRAGTRALVPASLLTQKSALSGAFS
jgi:hypothetical protein